MENFIHRIIRRWFPKGTNKGSFIVGDFENYSFTGNFDIIFAFASMIHSDMETTKIIFNKFYELLNTGGIVYISMKSSQKYTKVIKNDEFGERVYYHYSLDKYKKIAGKNFEVIYESKQKFNNQDWFTIAFRKVV